MAGALQKASAWLRSGASKSRAIPSETAQTTERKARFLDEIAEKLLTFTPTHPVVILDYSRQDYEASVGYRLAMSGRHAVEDLAIRLPKGPAERVKLERAIVHQIHTAREHQDPEALQYWEQLLKAYTPRSMETILGQSGLGKLVGMEGVKDRLQKRVIKPHLANDKNVPHFVLAYGPPGVGKTVAAQRLAEELGYRFIAKTYGDLSENGDQGALSYGEMAQRIRKAFSEAKAQAPSVLFLDEVSSLARVRRGAYTGNDASVTTEALLQELDYLKTYNSQLSNKDHRVLVVSAANHLSEISSAIKSRALKVEFPKPDKEQYQAIAQQKLVDAFEEYEILNASTELVQQAATMIAGAVPDSVRDVEAIAVAVAQSSRWENDGVVTLEIVQQEILSELQAASEQPATDDVAWKELADAYIRQGEALDSPELLLESNWLSPTEANMLESLLPDLEAFQKASIVRQGLFERALNRVTQNKMEFAYLALNTVIPLTLTGMAIAFSSGTLLLPLMLLGNSVLQGLKGVFDKLGIQEKQNEATRKLDERMHSLKEMISTKEGEERYSAEPSKPRFAGGLKSPQGSNVSQPAKTVSRQNRVTQSLEELKKLSNLLGSQLDQPKSLVSTANKMMTELEAVAEDNGDFRRKIKICRQWLNQYYEFKASVPESAKSFGDLSTEQRRLYRQILFKALSSNVIHLVAWGQKEAQRLGFSKKHIQQIVEFGQK